MVSDSGSPTSETDTVSKLLRLRQNKTNPARFTLLAVCPISPAIVDANLLAAAESDAPPIFTATLNQVDTDGGYSGWTPKAFARYVQSAAARIAPGREPVLCLDHGGPWKKDVHRSHSVSFGETWSAVQETITSCIEAGYEWLHIDTTVDLASHEQPSPGLLAERTEGLLAHAEEQRSRMGVARLHYEVGVEETASGEDSAKRLESMLGDLWPRLSLRSLPLPEFAVCDVGTQLDRSSFEADRATAAVRVADHFGALVKAHYCDDLAKPELFPKVGIGGANIGPGLAAHEVSALAAIETQCKRAGRDPLFVTTLFDALDKSGRWKKWVDAGVDGSLADVPDVRRQWLLQTGSRYVFQDPAVRQARQHLAATADELLGIQTETAVRDRLRRVLLRFYQAFNLSGLNNRL